MREAVDRGDVLVAVGGDGMLSSVADEVVANKGVLGIVPSGRGNDFARMLALPSEPEDVARLLLEAEPRAVDVIDAGRVVLGSVYAGVDSLASEIVDRAHRLPRSLQYPYAAIRAVLTFTPARFTIDVDGERLDVRACTVVIANSGYYGAGMHVAPSASLTDGLLDVVVITAPDTGPDAGGWSARCRGSTTARTSSSTRSSCCAAPRCRISADRPVTSYGDGERHTDLPLTATVRPGALQVLS